MILYRVYPLIFEPGSVVLVKVQLGFVFRGDPNHDGDIEHNVYFLARSTDPTHNHWRLVGINWRYCDRPDPPWESFEHTWDPDNGGPVGWYPETVWRGTTSYQIKHFLAYVGQDKHGVYPNSHDCEHCYHSATWFLREDCSEGWEGLAMYGIGGFDFHLGPADPFDPDDPNSLPVEVPAGFAHADAVAQYQSLTAVQQMYVGNVGEAWKDTGVNLENTVATDVADPRYIFMPTLRDSDAWQDHGRAGDLGGDSSYPLQEVSPIEGDWGVPGTWFHNYDNEYVWAAGQTMFCGGWDRASCPDNQVPAGVIQYGHAATVNNAMRWDTERVEQL
ncbi:MAG: hypothetical protein ABI333_24090, partial [bacterium]